MGFSEHEYWSGSPCPPPGDLPDPGIEPLSLMSPALAGGFFTYLCHLGTPYTAAHQASSSLGFSRQEHWSGLPFPSPMHESEK